MTLLIHLRMFERKSLTLMIYSLHNCILFGDQVSSRAHVLYGPCMCTVSVIEGDGTWFEENLRSRPFLIRYSKLCNNNNFADSWKVITSWHNRASVLDSVVQAFSWKMMLNLKYSQSQNMTYNNVCHRLNGLVALSVFTIIITEN